MSLNLVERINQSFDASIKVKQASSVILSEPIAAASKVIVQCLKRGNKILSCGNGGSAGDAAHFSAELVNRFQKERKNLAAIALTTDVISLTAIANDYSYDEIFAKQISALGNENDILLAISTSGNSKNILRAVTVAHKCKLNVIALTGNGGGAITSLLNEHDIEICVPTDVTARIQEIHALVIHCLCDSIDYLMFNIDSRIK